MATNTWLVLAVGNDRQHGGNAGYDDVPDTHYSWDSTVANHGQISPGDFIVLWDKHRLIGASVIESIATDASYTAVRRATKRASSNVKGCCLRTSVSVELSLIALQHKSNA